MIYQVKEADYPIITKIFNKWFFPNSFERNYFTPEKSIYLLKENDLLAFSWFSRFNDTGIFQLVFDSSLEDQGLINMLFYKSLKKLKLDNLKAITLISTKKIPNKVLNKTGHTLKRTEIKMIYNGQAFQLPELDLKNYDDKYFKEELELESELFYKFRKKHNWQPYSIKDVSFRELENIKAFFNKHKKSFCFYFKNNILVGSILLINDFIQSLCVAKEFQRKGYGSLLTKYAVNKALAKGNKLITLLVFADNTPAIKMYNKLGFFTARFHYVFSRS